MKFLGTTRSPSWIDTQNCVALLDDKNVIRFSSIAICCLSVRGLQSQHPIFIHYRLSVLLQRPQPKRLWWKNGGMDARARLLTHSYRGGVLGGEQRAIEIGDEVIDVLETDRQTHQVVDDSQLLALLRRHRRVRHDRTSRKTELLRHSYIKFV